VSIRLLSPAKINFGLRIVARRPDGYHEIETIFLPLDLCDDISVDWNAGPEIELRVSGAELPLGSANLAVRAAQAAAEALDLHRGVTIALHKRIPVAAGLGGGSSNAATTLLAIERLAQLTLPDALRHELALAIGADVPFFLNPTPALGRGVGEVLTPLSGIPALCWMLVAFPFGVSTPEVYREASARLTLPRQESSIAALLGPSGVVSRPPNDLESVTRRWHPEIELAQAMLHDLGAKVTGMSGSGPTVYGQFESRELAERAAVRAKAQLPRGARTIVAQSPASEG